MQHCHSGPLGYHLDCRRVPSIAENDISFVMSVRLLVRMEQLGCHRTDIHEIWYVSILRKSVEKIQVSLKLDKNSGYCTVLYCIVLYCNVLYCIVLYCTVS